LELDSKSVLERSQQMIEKKKRLQEVCCFSGNSALYVFEGVDVSRKKKRRKKRRRGLLQR
jgi:hypothetical protein